LSEPKSSYHHGDLKEALLSAAEQILTEEGVQGLTLRACARRAGVSHAAPKHHFADVAELLSEVSARGFDRLNAALQSVSEESGTDPSERFVAVARAYVGFARAYPDHFRLMFRRDAMSAENESLKLAAGHTFTQMINGVTLQRNEPGVTPETLRERSGQRELQNDILIAWSQIHGYSQLLLEGQFDGFAEKEGLDAFVERTVTETAGRLSQLLRNRA
jgi:AcrR family transcriptional regulator